MAKSGAARVVVPAVALALLATVAVDLARRALGHPEPPRRAAAGAVPSGRGPDVTTTTTALAAPAPGPAAGGAGRLDLATRTAALQRIALGEGDTYIAAMLAEGDSVLHRWGDERAGRPLRVQVRRDTVPGFTPAFTVAVSTALARWNEVGLPVRLEEAPDTGEADIVVTWSERLDGNRTGRTDLTWQSRGPIVHAAITLATHVPGGQLVLPVQMVALALHELGHAVGLDHSPDRGDVMYPETSATDLTLRDRRTALLLYSLPPGDLK